MFGRIWSLIKYFFLGQPIKPISPGTVVVATWLEHVRGKVYIVKEYSDGTIVKELSDNDDPTNIGSFLDDVDDRVR